MDNWKDLYDTLLKALILSVGGALIRALLAKGELWIVTLKTFLAGTVAGLICAYIVHWSQLSEGWKALIIASVSAFIAVLFPILQDKAVKWFKNKSHDATNH